MTQLPGRTVALYEKILEAVPGGVVYVAADGTLLLANEPAQNFLGLRLDQSGEHFVVDFDGETYHEDGSVCSVEDYPVSRCLVTGEPQPPRVIGVRQPTGDVRWAVFTALPFDPGDGNPPGAVVSFVDITARKDAEDEIRRLQAELAVRERLATVGTLAAAVAHEVNNPLAFIFLGLDNIREQLRAIPGVEPVVEDLEAVQDGARRVRDIVQDLTAFSRTNDSAEPTDVAAAIEAAVRLATPEARYRAHIRLDLEPGAQVKIASGRLSQVVLNLVLNACRSFRDAHPDPRVLVSSHINGEHVEIDVVDNGSGIAPDIASRIFDPFFTTGADGTGLGLAISTSLVEQVGGSLRLLESEVGAHFRVCLPSPTD